MKHMVSIMLLCVGCTSPTGPAPDDALDPNEPRPAAVRRVSTPSVETPVPIQLRPASAHGITRRQHRKFRAGRSGYLSLSVPRMTVRIEIPAVTVRTRVVLTVPDTRQARAILDASPDLGGSATPNLIVVLKISNRPVTVYHRSESGPWVVVLSEQQMTRQGLRVTATLPSTGEIVLSDGTSASQGSDR